VRITILLQLYRADYVKLHFVHYSTITQLTMMNKQETEASGNVWRLKIGADPKGRFTDELSEGTSLVHTTVVPFVVPRRQLTQFLRFFRTNSNHASHQGSCKTGHVKLEDCVQAQSGILPNRHTVSSWSFGSESDRRQRWVDLQLLGKRKSGRLLGTKATSSTRKFGKAMVELRTLISC